MKVVTAAGRGSAQSSSALMFMTRLRPVPPKRGYGLA